MKKLQEQIAIPAREYPELIRMLDEMGYKKKRGPASLVGVGVMHCVRKEYARWRKQIRRKNEI